MDFELTDEQRLIQETVRDFVDARVLPNAVENDINHHLDLGVIEGMAELGLLGIVIPEEYGGAGLDFVAEALSCEEIERGEAAFGGEVSGHYYFRDFSQADSGVIPFLLMLERVSREGRKLAEILRPFRERYFITGELNTPVADVALKLQELKERFGVEGTVSHLDGLSVDAKDWHMNVRPSNTEPLLRLNLEALTPDLMERKRDEALAVIRGEGLVN